MDSRENEAFTNRLRNAVGEAEKLKYRPTHFKRMLDAYGGFDTVNRILANGKPSEGFTKLWELGRLDLTCEAIVVETEWRRHFDEDLLAKAEKLLREMGYSYKLFEEPADTKSLASGGRAATKAAGPSVDQLVAEASPASDLRINAFFKDILHAPVANARWSWGSVNERTRRVFLRLWRMDIIDLDGRQIVRVLGPVRSDRPGWKERARHLELIRSGYAAYGVLCDKESPDAGVIRSFDHKRLLGLGRIVEQNDMVYMEIERVASVESICSAIEHVCSIPADLQEVNAAEMNATTRAALVDARLGQGRFRRELLRRWNGACAVTGCRVGAVLRASHCKPWRLSNNIERLDSNNGLVLSATLDALFDAGLISFDDNGAMLVADVISMKERSQLGLPATLLRPPGAKLKAYLRFHRDQVFLSTDHGPSGRVRR